jgi:tetratricopeptide (TPR) repeat protein
MNKTLGLLLFLFFLSSCENIKKSTRNDGQNKVIDGYYYENLEAAELNKNGIELSKNGDLKKGKEAFLKALKLEPSNPTTLSNLGLNYYLTKDYDNAIKYYKESYKISDSTYHMAAINLGLTYFYNKEFDKGIEITTYAIEHAKDKDILSSAYVNRALNYFGNNKCNETQTDLNYIISNFQGIRNIEYHIKDLTGKIKNCVQHSI